MRKYLQMLMTQLHRPAAAPDFFSMSATVNLGMVRYLVSTSATHSSLTLSLSKLMRDVRKPSTEPMNFFAAFQDTSLGILPLAKRIITAAVTAEIILSTLEYALSSPSDFLSSELSAASASWMMGSALARSSAHSAWTAETSSAMAAHSASSAAPASTAASTTAFSFPMETMSWSVAFFFSSTMICSCLRFTCSSLTCADANAILSTPFSSLAFASESARRLLASMSLYNEMSSRYDLGVV
mmetsp:Transcript_14065/g.57166  ORF Transcript_14065/g.57166 Transcript_14065/m.57166 type:complete len:241 (+) Transcript_14065:1284-2006(+)